MGSNVPGGIIMANEKVETTFRNIVPNFTKYSTNMFSKIVGSKYAKKFHEVYYADIESRDDKMKALYEEAKTDTGLKDIQKKIIEKCYIAYLAAVGSNCNISIPIIAYLNKKKPSIYKIIKSDIRTKRNYYDLYDVVERSGFKFEIQNFPDLLKVFMVQFKQQDEEHLYDDDYLFENVVLIVLSKFSRALPNIAVVNIWYMLMFMKNIGSLAYITKETFESNERLKDQVKCILKTVYAINLIVKKEIDAKEQPATSS